MTLLLLQPLDSFMKRRSIRTRKRKGGMSKLSTTMNTPFKVRGATPKGMRKY